MVDFKRTLAFIIVKTYHKYSDRKQKTKYKYPHHIQIAKVVNKVD